HLRLGAALHPDGGHPRYARAVAGPVRFRERLSVHPAAALPGGAGHTGHPRTGAAEAAGRQRQAAARAEVNEAERPDSACFAYNPPIESHIAHVLRTTRLMPDDLDAAWPAGSSKPSRLDRYRVPLASMADTLAGHL